MKKSYKDYERKFIGASDYSKLSLVGCDDDGLKHQFLCFGCDDSYIAYIVDEDAEIADHYNLVVEFQGWLKIYDDSSLVIEFSAEKIKVYRAMAYGCIIQTIGRKEEAVK